MMSSASGRCNRARPWSALPSDELEDTLAGLGICINHPEEEFIRASCGYALKGAGDTMSKHL